MAFENLFIRVKKSLAGVQLDAVVNENYENQVSLTNNPVELGANITDNAIVEPKKLSITAYVTDTPLGGAAIGQIVDDVTGFFGSSTDSNVTRSNAAYLALIEIMERREPIQVQTKLLLYENMVITAISTVKDKKSTFSLPLIINMQEVIIVESATVNIESEQLPEGSTRTQATSAENKGLVAAKDPDENVKKSALKKLTDWLN